MSTPDQLEDEPEVLGDELAAGTSLANGTYTIQKHLKSGGFGITYLAHDTFGRRVVIKECFPSGMCARPSRSVRVRSRAYTTNVSGLIEKFVAEAHSLARLKHPNIVNVHQVFKENDTAYMALDYVEGPDLLDIMADPAQALAPADIRSALLKLLDAIAIVHDTGLLHRDISPDNILIDQNRNPVLIDFGAARNQTVPVERAASTLHIVKDGYSPQELYMGGKDQGPWSDLYSLAATFYHLISGVAPPNSQTRLAALATNAPDPCVPLAGRFPSYEPEFLAAIDKAMSVLPKSRIQAARIWIAAISDSNGDNVLHLPTADTPRPVRPTVAAPQSRLEGATVQPNRTIIAAGVAAAALIAVGVFFAMPQSDVATGGKAIAAETLAAASSQPATAGGTSDQAINTGWTLELPFAASANNPAMVGATDPVVPSWLVPGLQIVAVNGTPVDSIDQVVAHVRATVDPGDAAMLGITLSTVVGPGGKVVDHNLDLPVLHELALQSGARFQEHVVNGTLLAQVEGLPPGYQGDMRVGDIVVGDVATGAKFDGIGALQKLIETEIAAGGAATTLAIERDGEMWVASLPLPK